MKVSFNYECGIISGKQLSFFLPQMIGNCGSNTKIAVLDFVFGSLNHFREHMYFNCASFWTQIESCLRL